ARRGIEQRRGRLHRLHPKQDRSRFPGQADPHEARPGIHAVGGTVTNMTRRLAISMLLIFSTILIAAGVTAYVTTRSVLLTTIEAGLVTPPPPVIEEGRKVIKNQLGQTLDARNRSSAPEIPPELIRAGFARLGDGTRLRTVAVRIWTRNDAGELEQITVT